MIDRMFSLDVLGPPSLQRDGHAVPLPARKLLALLMLLALSPAPLPRGRVAALLWPSLDESTGRRNLRRELARLRGSAAADTVQTEADMLALSESVSCDAISFIRLLQADQRDEALALWRGTPADGFALGDAEAFDDWLAQRRTELQERRRQALQASAAACESAGDGSGALARIDALLADDPLQEQHHRDAMRLLAAAGRREAALARYERCRLLLRDELGLTPTEETEALAAALRGSTVAPLPLLEAVASTRASNDVEPSRRPFIPNDLPFVGRDDEVRQLEAAWSEGRPAVVEGVGGVGKSRLATDFAAAHGPFALARCRFGDAELPYASFARALRSLMGPVPELPPLPGWAIGELTRLVPELGPAPPPIRSDEERNRFFEACALGWRALSADSFDAVVLDDWHLADTASRALLGFIVRRRAESGEAGARELFVLRPELDEATDAALRELIDAARGIHLTLQPLAGGAVLDLIARLAGGGRPARFAARLAQATGGNPFFIAETLRHLAECGHLASDETGVWHTPFDNATEDYRELPVPASVRDAVLGRVRRLPSPSRRVLEAASLTAEPFQPSLLAPACALSELDAVLAIEAAVEAALLREHPAGGYAFAHDLIQHSLASALSAERARLVHRRLALGAEAAGAPAATIAAHHEASGEPGRAVRHRIAAGDAALALRALPDAITHWQRALADGPSPAEALHVHERISQAAFDRTDFALVGEQADALGRLLDTTAFAAEERLAATVMQASALARAGRGADALAVLDALIAEPAGRLRMQALLTRARAFDALGRGDRASAAIDAALAEPATSDADRVQLLDFAFLCAFNAGDNAVSLLHADAAMALALRLGDGAHVARSHFRRGIVLITAHDLAGAEDALLAAAEGASRLGLVRLERIALYNLTCAYGSQSRHADALAAARRGWSLQPPLEASDFRIVFRLALVDAYFGLGDVGAAWQEAEPAVHEAIAHEDLRMCIGAASCVVELLGMIGQTGLADRLIERVRREDEGALKAAADEMWIAVAQYGLRRGDPHVAVEALARLDQTGEAVMTRVKVRDAQARAELALAQDDPASALARLPADDVVGMNGEMRMRGLALRIDAEGRCGPLSATTASAARAALESTPEHAIAQLELSRAFSRAGHQGAGVAGASVLDAHAALVARLGDSLRGRPNEQSAFHSHWQLPA